MIKVKQSDGTWKQVTGEGSGSIISKTYGELKAMKTAGTLTAGQLYRITNYVAYTSQNNTQSANHPFDIIVQAISTNTLSEDAMACLHSGDTYFASCKLNAWEIKYSMDADTAKRAWDPSTELQLTIEGELFTEDTTKTTTLYEFDEENKYRYFKNDSGTKWYVFSGTDTIVEGTYLDKEWELTCNEEIGEVGSNYVCLKNSTLQFIRKSEYDAVYYTPDMVAHNLYCWEDEDTLSIYTTSETPAVGDACVDHGDVEYYALQGTSVQVIKAAVTPSAYRGTIYYMKDEYNNEAGYDFKGITMTMVNVASMDSTHSTYLTKTTSQAWLNLLVPKGSTMYGYTLGTTETEYYTFGTTTDESLTGASYCNKVEYQKNIPMVNISGWYNEVGSSKGSTMYTKNVVIQGYNNKIRGIALNVFLGKYSTTTEDATTWYYSEDNTIEGDNQCVVYSRAMRTNIYGRVYQVHVGYGQDCTINNRSGAMILGNVLNSTFLAATTVYTKDTSTLNYVSIVDSTSVTAIASLTRCTIIDSSTVTINVDCSSVHFRDNISMTINAKLTYSNISGTEKLVLNPNDSDVTYRYYTIYPANYNGGGFTLSINNYITKEVYRTSSGSYVESQRAS